MTAIWSKPSTRLADLCAVLLILLISAVTAAIGAVHTRIFGHDIFIFLDAGWRVLNGQRPEINFNPSMGPLLSLLSAAGLKLAHNSPNGIGYMSALVGGIAGCWAYAISRRRMAAIPATLAGIVVALIATAPFPIGWPPNVLSHAMLYNRYGYALLGLVVLECFQPGQSTLIGGVSTGVVSVALLFLKPSYCLVALGFAACSVVIEQRGLRRILGIAIGLSAAGLAMMAYLRFDFAAFGSDLRLMSAARSSSLSLWNVRWSLFKGLGDFLPLALLAVLASSLTLRLRPLLVTALVWIGGALLLATNAQPSGYPLNALLALLLVEQGRAAIARVSWNAPRFPKPETVLILLGLICYAPIAIGDASGLAYALVDSHRNPPVARFHATPLRNLILYDTPDGTDADQRSNGRAYVDYVNDGVDLIQRVSKPDQTVFTLDMVNPFPYALLRRPPEGGTPALAFNHTFNDQHKPSPKWLFGSADIVMVPKHPASSEPDAAALFRNYLPAIQSKFTLCAESDWWKLYRRR
ncbi:MAG TPA: hypothetical protein VMH05_26205 [Bryobacteraceae bacterium]|nr:hypothetical protein [Bryobacteraceae bacterium]